MANQTVLCDISEGICTLTLNRPDRLNAWTSEMHSELKDALYQAGANPDVRVIILTGAGRGFCAGADMGGLQAIGGGASPDRKTKAQAGLPGGSTLAEFRMPYSYFPAIPKFIISAINGPAAGLGFIKSGSLRSRPWPRPRPRPTTRWSSPSRPPTSRRASPTSSKSAPPASPGGSRKTPSCAGSGHITNPSRVIGGGAPLYGAEGEGHTRAVSDSDVGISSISSEAFPLRPLRGHLPRKTGEGFRDVSIP